MEKENLFRGPRVRQACQKGKEIEKCTYWHQEAKLGGGSCPSLQLGLSRQWGGGVGRLVSESWAVSRHRANPQMQSPARRCTADLADSQLLH